MALSRRPASGPGPSGTARQRHTRRYSTYWRMLADDPLPASIVGGGTGFMHGLMAAVGPAADGMIASSRRRLLEHLRAGEAALEMESTSGDCTTCGV